MLRAPIGGDGIAPRTAALVVACLLALAWAMSAPAAALGADPCAQPVTNPIACENSKPGDPPSDWYVGAAGDVTNPGDPSIQGFATSMSVNVGQTISFKIKTDASSYHFDILRLGYYGGLGARIIAKGLRPSAKLPQSQPSCLTDSSTGLIDCGNWAVSASWTVPSTAVSGVYIAHLIRDDTNTDSQIIFVVRDDSSHSSGVFQTSDATWEAYNTDGGNSLYQCTVACPPGNPGGYKAAYAVSYNRPFDGYRGAQGASWFYYAEYPMIRFLEANGYNISYMSSSDVDSRGSLLLNHNLFLSTGHDEYWSAQQRANIQAARDAGVNLAFFSGNEGFWKTRWGASIDGSSTAYRTLTTYKETHFNAPVDPQDPTTWTGSWRDPRFSPPADGGQPENALTGQYFVVNNGTSDITVPYPYGKLRLWRNTAAATKTSGQSLTLDPGAGTLGLEWDVDADNGFRPAGLFDLSSTTASNVTVFNDYGTNTTTGTATHHLTEYRAKSGALVFGAGTVQWPWGLDATNPSGAPVDPNMQQATVNLFADMGVQPSTLMSGLVPATQSTDTTPPTSTITSPSAGSTVQNGSQVTITGTASDSGGGIVAGVEVSTDGGTTWHPASGTTSWSYTWTATRAPGTTIKSRAVDDSGNLESPSAGVSVNVPCPCSIFGTQAPGTADAGDASGVELGVKFKSDTYGTVSGVRFYKSSANTGTHVGSLWTASGTRLAQATFTGESASGWQTVTFSSPVVIYPNTTYVASYYAPNGHYAATPGWFYPPPSPPPIGGGSVDSPPLHGIINNTSANGLYNYASASSFPASTFNATNYWVDVLFTPAAPPGGVANVNATAGHGSATVSWNAPTAGGPPATYKITAYIGSTAQTTTTFTGSPPATTAKISGLTGGTTYTFTVTPSNPNGSGPESDQSNAVTPTPVTAPIAPTGVAVTPATSSVQVNWTTPADDGGSPITGYTITPYVGANAQTPVQVNSGSATSAVATGLTNMTSYTFTVAATNSIGTGPASAASAAATPQNTIFDFGAPAAATADSGDPNSVEIGVKFKADASGTVTGIRFYKSAANTGTHIGDLWTASGTLLASAQFSGETASGWQTVNFSQPVQISAGTTYVASYYAPNGHYSYTSSGLSSPTDNALLHSIANSVSANGVYTYHWSNAFPTSSYNASNYWVDVMFARTPVPGQVTGVTATAGQASATVSWSAPTTGGAPTSYTITPYIGSTAQTPTQVTSSPLPTTATVRNLTAGTAYTFTVTASDANGAGPESAPSGSATPTATTAPTAPQNVAATPATSSALVTWSAPSSDGGSSITGYVVTPYIGTTAQTPTQVPGAAATSATVPNLTNGTTYTFTITATNGVGTGTASAGSSAVTPENTIFDFSTPAIVDAGADNGVNLGVKFKSDVPGALTGVRFYKAAANIGTHVGSLWASDGTPLASATFTGETSSGWQTVTFSSPVRIVPGNIYVASYYAPSGHYSFTSSGFSSAIDNAPLHAVASSTSANGVFGYGGPTTFPSSSYNSSNYWVDVMFAQTQGATAPSAPGGVIPSPASSSAQVSWTPPASDGGSPLTGYVITPYIGSTAQTTTQVSSASATSAAVTGLTNGTAYTFKVAATNGLGTSPQSAASPAATPEDTIFDFGTPATVDSHDGNAVELGVKFTADASGTARGVRFYKSAGNTGTHVGNLWSSTGTLLATASFSNETASGWQTVLFSTPVSITSGTTYIVSYFAPSGHYSDTPSAFGSPLDNPPLHAVSNSTSPNGVFIYTASSAFPVNSGNGTNYWVDLLFNPGG